MPKHAAVYTYTTR